MSQMLWQQFQLLNDRNKIMIWFKYDLKHIHHTQTIKTPHKYEMSRICDVMMYVQCATDECGCVSGVASTLNLPVRKASIIIHHEMSISSERLIHQSINPRHIPSQTFRRFIWSKRPPAWPEPSSSIICLKISLVFMSNTACVCVCVSWHICKCTHTQCFLWFGPHPLFIWANHITGCDSQPAHTLPSIPRDTHHLISHTNTQITNYLPSTVCEIKVSASQIIAA